MEQPIQIVIVKENNRYKITTMSETKVIDVVYFNKTIDAIKLVRVLLMQLFIAAP